ncbi:hypothetical protein Prum_092220 [Phytohabitans rumicis]|uniref:Uncharacterized protein n=1 Tax=Phytohabitans rumicis TaxID=1076125 RepID=A0A6V8LJ50_9ACTN|nr:hypothetical protein Prum_092220 [Phytohabitans rumicis]
MEVVGGLPIAPQPPVDDAEAVEGTCFTNVVAGLSLSGPGVAGGRPGATRWRCADAVAATPEQTQGFSQMHGGLSVPAHLQVDGAEVGQCAGLSVRVAGTASGLVGVVVDGQGVGEVSAGEVAMQDDGQPNGMGRPAVGGGVRGDSDQVGSFGVQPGACVVQVGQFRGGRAGWGMWGRRYASAG